MMRFQIPGDAAHRDSQKQKWNERIKIAKSQAAILPPEDQQNPRGERRRDSLAEQSAQE